MLRDCSPRALFLLLPLAACTAPAPRDAGSPSDAPARAVPTVPAAPATPTARAPQDLVLMADTSLGGRLELGSLYVAPGVTVDVVDDLHLSASGWVVVDGTLVGVGPSADGAAGAPAGQPSGGGGDGPSITLDAGRGLVVRGLVRGGDGRSYAGLDPDATAGLAGGAGGDVRLRASSVVVTGRVEGGRGGDGGGGADGGDGGSVEIVERDLDDARRRAPTADGDRRARLGDHVGYLGGAGGRGGDGVRTHPDGGDGGQSGGVRHSAGR